MWLGLSVRFRARWSARIHDEWKRNLLINRPDLSAEQLDRTSDLMESAHVCLEIQRRTTCRDCVQSFHLERLTGSFRPGAASGDRELTTPKRSLNDVAKP